MKKKLIIIGTGLFPELAKSYFEEFTDYTVVAFACHKKFKESDVIYGSPLVEIERLLFFYDPKDVEVFVALGYKSMNKIRQMVFEEIKRFGYNIASFIHPNVKIWSSSSIGENVFIFEDNTIQPFTHIGNNTILWSGNHVGHHTQIGNHCFISSHVVISGSCKIGNNVFIGVNATLQDNISIADETLIGPRTLITKNSKFQQVLVSKGTKPFPKNSVELGF